MIASRHEGDCRPRAWRTRGVEARRASRSEIESVGANVKTYKPGDRVFIHGTAAEHTHGHYGGGYAQKAVCNLDHLYRLPASVTFGQGAAMGVPYATAYRALFHKAQTRPGDTVLIHGATGGVGLA